MRLGVVEEVKLVLERAGCKLRYNEFTRSISIDRPGEAWHELNDMDWAWMVTQFLEAQVKGAAGPGVRAIVETLAHSRENRYHPVREYLDGLKWDGVPRLDKWLLTYLTADDKGGYTEAIGKNTLIAAVRRVRKPGTKFDEMLTLVGQEGVGKSRAVEALVPDRDWCSDSLPLGEGPKETIERTRGVWLCESAELVSRKDVSEIKAFLSRSVDGPVRAAYGRTSGSVPRQFIAIATTNEAAFLRSMTGDRRFWPVRVKYVDVKKLVADRDQLWAEASIREAAGEQTHLPSDLWATANQEQETYRAEDPWELKLNLDKLGQLVKLETIYNLLQIPTAQQTQQVATRVTNVMTKQGYKKVRRMENGTRFVEYEYLSPFHPDSRDYNPDNAQPETSEPADYDPNEDQYEEED